MMIPLLSLDLFYLEVFLKKQHGKLCLSEGNKINASDYHFN